MKRFLIFIAVLIFAGCQRDTKQKTISPAEEATRKPPKALPAVTTDLLLMLDGSTLTCTLSPNAEWAGIQKYVSQTTNDGAIAIWEAQRYFSSPPGAGATTSCPAQGTGYYRGWCSDFDRSVHLSNWIFIP